MLNVLKKQICSSKISGELNAVILSDLHSNFQYNEKILSYVKRQEPDFVFLLGDMPDIRKTLRGDFKGLTDLLNDLAALTTLIYIDGNHEEKLKWVYPHIYEAYMEDLSESIIRLNDGILHFDDFNVSIAGLSIPNRYYSKLEEYDFSDFIMPENLINIDKSRYNILLAHNPYVFDIAKKEGYDLQLSGHMHGGGVRLPKVGGVLGPNLLPFPRYDYGSYKFGEQRLIVSPGLGDHSVIFRMNNPHSIIHLRLVGRN